MYISPLFIYITWQQEEKFAVSATKVNLVGWHMGQAFPAAYHQDHVLFYVNSTSWKFKTGTMITFLYIGIDHRMAVLWHLLHVFTQIV